MSTAEDDSSISNDDSLSKDYTDESESYSSSQSSESLIDADDGSEQNSPVSTSNQTKRGRPRKAPSEARRLNSPNTFWYENHGPVKILSETVVQQLNHREQSLKLLHDLPPNVDSLAENINADDHVKCLCGAGDQIWSRNTSGYGPASMQWMPCSVCGFYFHPYFIGFPWRKGMGLFLNDLLAKNDFICKRCENNNDYSDPQCSFGDACVLRDESISCNSAKVMVRCNNCNKWEHRYRTWYSQPTPSQPASDFDVSASRSLFAGWLAGWVERFHEYIAR